MRRSSKGASSPAVARQGICKVTGCKSVGRGGDGRRSEPGSAQYVLQQTTGNAYVT
jgi:hypothetical protein